ncbi:hypothetical protein [Oceanobacillus manasiensis]|uniref:hypothetical protein n=1 Tax=Oceanobacillus manasiensis TaxID=586413 RepID=UPI0005A692C9|nr:hypothetical protein [Oceanobacillus manasiensis]
MRNYLLLAGAALLILSLAACSGEQGLAENRKRVVMQEDSTNKIKEAEINFFTYSEQELLDIAQTLRQKYQKLLYAQTEEEYNLVKKELLTEEMLEQSEFIQFTGPKTNQVTKITNEVVTKATSYFLYDFEYKESFQESDGSKRREAGYLSLEIVKEGDDYKINAIR